MKILFNPENGAEIKNFVFKNEQLMDAKEGQSFMPGMIIKIDDDSLADFMLSNWGFLQEKSYDEAKEFLDSKEEFKCADCEFKTKYKLALFNHNKKHLKESRMDELGLPVVKLKNEPRVDPVLKDDSSRQKAWDEEDKRAGLIGEGLTDDRI